LLKVIISMYCQLHSGSVCSRYPADSQEEMPKLNPRDPPIRPGEKPGQLIPSTYLSQFCNVKTE
jgi:hypothetical protein